MKKNFFYTVLLSIVNILFPVLSFPYAAHILGPAGIGKVQMVVSFAQQFAILAALGIPIYGIKETARFREDPLKLARVFTELTLIYFIASCLFFMVYLTVIYTFPFFEPARIMYLYAGLIVFLAFSDCNWFYIGLEQFRAITLRSVIIKAISLFLLFTYVKTENDFIKYLGIMIFSILGNQLLSFFMIFRKTNFHFAGLDFRRHIRPIFYIFGASVASSIYTVLDTVLLGFLSTTQAVGLYTSAVKLIRITLPFVTAMGTILMPGIAKSFSVNDMGEIKKLLDSSFKFLTFFTLPVCVGIAILSPELIFIFSGKDFLEATVSMQILSLLPLLVGFGHFFHLQVLIPAGRNKEVFISMVAGVIVFLILNFLLVPMFSQTGAAIANIITEVVVTVCYFFFTRKYYTLHYDWKFFIQSFVSILPFLPVILLIRAWHTNMFVTVLSAIVTCTILYVSAHLFVFKNTFLLNFIRPFLSRLRVIKP